MEERVTQPARTSHYGPFIMAFNRRLPIGEVWMMENKHTHEAQPARIVREATKEEYLGVL